jgi:voltage-gated potassium channel
MRQRLFFQAKKGRRRTRWRTPVTSAVQASATIFLILRRMRAPLITLISIFAVSVLGLTLIPGRDAAGAPARLSIFDAFYFMSYTATTIGFGELPHPFTAAQRLWVMVTIYLTVIGWAYALGSLLTLLQDRKFRQALAVQHFTRKVRRLNEPFLLFAGYGRTGQALGRAMDALGRRLVVVDLSEERIDALDVDQYGADVPGLVGNAANPHILEVAGLGHPDCEAVLAMTDDDEVNLTVVMAATLLRPEVPIVARTASSVIAHRMRAFGSPTVINPFDRFGDRLRLALRAPASYQLLTWLETGPGTTLPSRAAPPGNGRWVVCGYGRFGREIAADLRDNGAEVTVLDPAANPGDGGPQMSMICADASDPEVMKEIGLHDAVGFVAGTDNDTTNLCLVAAARRINPGLFVVARQNDPDTSPMFAQMRIDSLLVATEVVTHEAYAQLSSPLLWQFLARLPEQGDEWADRLIGRLADHCGFELQMVRETCVTGRETPALGEWLAGGEARLGDLLREPADPDRPLGLVTLLLHRADGEMVVSPGDDERLGAGDTLLLVGPSAAHTALNAILAVETRFTYVVHRRYVPAGTLWRWIARRRTPGS